MYKNMDILRELFESYTDIGDKFNFNNITLSGYKKFLNDIGLVKNEPIMPKSNLHSSRTMTRTTPWKSNNALSRNNSNFLTPRKNHSMNTDCVNKKVLDCDIEIIFNSLCGIRHFDMEKRSHYFNKNKGLSSGLNNSQFSAKMDNDKKSLSILNTPVPNKMNFNLFLKSFESAAVKIYPLKEVQEAFVLFYKNYLENLFSNQFSAKRNILDLIDRIKQDEVVSKKN
jgi:hypothetical protein